MASGGIPFGWKGPVVNFRSSVGPWRSWERASMASRRSWVRIPSAPPTFIPFGLSRWLRFSVTYFRFFAANGY